MLMWASSRGNGRRDKPLMDVKILSIVTGQVLHVCGGITVGLAA